MGLCPPKVRLNLYEFSPIWQKDPKKMVVDIGANGGLNFERALADVLNATAIIEEGRLTLGDSS
jgi:hypothetical protein